MFWFIFRSSKRSSKNNFYDFTAINNIVSITGSAIYVHSYSALYFFSFAKTISKIKAETSAKIYMLATMNIFAEVPHYIDCIVPLCQTSEIANNACPI